MPQIDAFVFDMDGVLVDSQLQWHKVQHDFLAGLVSKWTSEDQSRIIGMSIDDVHKLLVSEYGATVTRDEMLDYYKGLAGEIYGVRSSLLPGVESLIKDLSFKNYKLAVASSSIKSWIEIVIERFSLGPYFSEAVSSDDVGARGKPAPDIYIKACELLGVEPAKAIAIEDAQKGVQSAKAAGMFCIGIKNGFNEEQDLSQADSVISGFVEHSAESLLALI